MLKPNKWYTNPGNMSGMREHDLVMYSHSKDLSRISVFYGQDGKDHQFATGHALKFAGEVEEDYLVQYGEDYLVLADCSQQDIQNLLKFFKQQWEESVVQDDQGRLESIANTVLVNSDFVIYENARAFKKWQKMGWSKYNAKTAVLVIITDDKEMWLTYSDKLKSAKFIHKVRKFLLENKEQ